MKIVPGLMALSIGAFGIGVTEFAPMGLLPVIADDLRVSIPTAGLLISAYALGVVVGVPLMTLATRSLPRRTLLIGLAGIFTLGNALAAMSDSYAMLLVARIVTAFNHGAFFGIGSIVAASLVPPERKAAAVASMFMGLAVANIGGVPLAAWAGEHLGWRASFWGIAAVGIVVMISLRLTLPPLPATTGRSPLDELRVLRRGPVLVALALTTVSSSALFVVYTYVVPILRTETHASLGFVTAMLVTFGVGLTAGNWFGGKYADRSVDHTLVGALGLLAMVLIAFAALMPFAAATPILVFLWGFASFAILSPLQVRVLSAAHDAPDLSAAMNIGAFNLGNALGAALGGGVIAVGLGYPVVALAGAAMACIGLAIVVLGRRFHPQRQQSDRS